MKQNLFIILFDLLLLYLLVGHSLWRRLLPRRAQVRHGIKEMEHHLKHYLVLHRDLLSAGPRQRLEEEIVTVRSWLAAGDPARIDGQLQGLRARLDQLTPAPPHPRIREYLEIMVVAFTLAFGARALFLQPFKIPTGSMEPSLYGIHFVAMDTAPPTSPVRRFFDYLHFSKRYVNAVVQQPGYLEAVSPARPAIPFFPATVVRIGGIAYRLPGGRDTLPRVSPKIAEFMRNYGPGSEQRLPFEAGEVLARGYLELGDHLFVDRVRYHFTEPRRGDITVFITDGIADQGGGSLGGRYYIKRLAGLPGDTLRITDHRLYVKPAGAAAFHLVDAGEAPAFARLYSFQGGYRGYCHFPQSQYLTNNGAEYTLPADQYFMLGDNSENSKDSRFWGTVPRENLVGRACFSWWPFSRRWGFTDVAEPLPQPTPPNPGLP
ncbi:MAG: signal peptidase I [bacterium]